MSSMPLEGPLEGPLAPLAGRVALITGSSRGVGRGIALCLARDGAHVAINYRRDEAAAKEVQQAVAALGRTARIYSCDMSRDYETVGAMVDQVATDFGRLDIVVNNAGIASRGQSVFDTDVAELQRVMNVHFFGAYYCTKAALPHLRRQPRADVVFITSTGAERPRANGVPYTAAKRAMEAMSIGLAQEEVRHGIHVNVVRPGLVETDMGRRLMKAIDGVDDLKDLYATYPFGRVCQPEDIGNAVSYLCSERAGYVSGTVLTVAGGPYGIA